jgi:hypothetical protein
VTGQTEARPDPTAAPPTGLPVITMIGSVIIPSGIGVAVTVPMMLQQGNIHRPFQTRENF